MNTFDCVIIGAGPAGLSASLTLGRARRNIALFDDGTNRNRVTQESHGYLTRDGIKPQQFKDIGLNEVKKYPSVSYFSTTVTKINHDQKSALFIIKTKDNQLFTAEKIILATGIQETFPIPSIREYYGKSIFNCPYCDGWEMRDKPLIIIAEKEAFAMHMVKLLYGWSRDLVVATNGTKLSDEAVEQLNKRKISLKTEPIKNLIGDNGYLEQVEFESGEIIQRSGGFVVPTFHRPNQFAEQLGCKVLEDGVVVTDSAGRTTIKNIYIVGETEKASSSSLIIAAADGQKVATSVNMDLAIERF